MKADWQRRMTRLPFLAALLMGAALEVSFCAVGVSAGPSQAAAPQAAASKSVGTIEAISGNTITLSVEGGRDLTVVVQDGARLLRVEPGQTDLKTAAPLALDDLQPGDRILVRGKASEDGKSLLAVSVIAMKKADIAEKRAHERDEWQKHSVGGLVRSVDAQAGSITISTSAIGSVKDVTVKVSKDTVLRRYAPNSVKFDDAKPAPLDQVKPGDQLRARGARSPEGSELTADEVVSGSFRNIAGTVDSIDAAGGTITVTDLATKKPVLVAVNATSQLRKLPQPMAQRIAARLKGTLEGTAANGSAPGDGNAAPADRRPVDQGAAGGSPGAGAGQRPGGFGGQGAGGQAGGDLQQAIGRLPAATLSELQKGDAVMIVASSGAQDGQGVTAITLLAGVEPILQSSPNKGQSILTPWSLGGAPGGDAAAQ
jgi:Domain of unknown function (DUF5666)